MSDDKLDIDRERIAEREPMPSRGARHLRTLLKPSPSARPMKAESGKAGFCRRINFACPNTGAIRLVSTPGKGTIFQILLPCAKDAAKTRPSIISRAQEETLGSLEATILVVEDEDLLRQPTARMLRRKGFSVIEAIDGTAALDLIQAGKDPIDVLVLDVTLPGASSREVLKEAKRRRPGLPVIVASANSEEMAAASLGGRVERFIRKPFGLDELIRLIRESLISS
jgi:two-component system cell cycle sensor histidine kinase/response regulator CckA